VRYRGFVSTNAPDTPETPEQPKETPAWSPPPKPSFNSPAADLNQLRNEAKRIAESAPGQAVHKSVLDRARALASAIEHDLGLPQTPDGLAYADLAVLLSQSK
jgi:hypothetical protein